MIELLMSLLFHPVTSYPPIKPVEIREYQRITPLFLLKQHHKVTQGTVCFYPLEVKCIDDKCGDDHSYWEVAVNGDTSHYNANSRIKKSDSVVWRFVSSKQK